MDQLDFDNSWYVVPVELELIDIAKDESLYNELWFFTQMDQDNFFLLDMLATYQCTFSITPTGFNTADVVVSDYANCEKAGTYDQVSINQADLTFTFEGKDYYMVTEFAWNTFFDKFS